MTVARRHLHELESKKKNAQHCLHTTTILIIVVRWVVEAEGGRDTRQRSQTTDNCLDFGPLRGAIVIRVTCDYHNPEPYTYVVRFPSTWMSPCDFDRQKKIMKLCVPASDLRSINALSYFNDLLVDITQCRLIQQEDNSLIVSLHCSRIPEQETTDLLSINLFIQYHESFIADSFHDRTFRRVLLSLPTNTTISAAKKKFGHLHVEQ